MFTKKGADASGRMNAIYMAINGIIDIWRVSLRSQIYSPEGNLGCHGLFVSHGTGSRESGTGSRDVRRARGQLKYTAPSTLCLHGTCGRASCRDGNLT